MGARGSLRWWFGLSRTHTLVGGETTSSKIHELSIDDLFYFPSPLRVSLYLIATFNLPPSLLLYVAFGTLHRFGYTPFLCQLEFRSTFFVARPYDMVLLITWVSRRSVPIARLHSQHS